MQNFGSLRYTSIDNPPVKSDVLVSPNITALVQEFCEGINGEVSILELGAGQGRVTLPLLESLQNLRLLELVEPSEAALEQIRSKIEEKGAGNELQQKISLLNCSIGEYLILPNRPKFDCIVLSMVLLHLSQVEVQDVLSNIGTLLKPDGKIIIGDLHSSRSNGLALNQLLTVTLPTTNPEEDFVVEYYPRAFETYLEILNGQGFQVERIVIPRVSDEDIREHPMLFGASDKGGLFYKIALVRAGI
jgi:SAM-dependent methyltransferase